MTVGFMIVEVVAADLVASLALLADARHMLTDAGARERRSSRDRDARARRRRTRP